MWRRLLVIGFVLGIGLLSLWGVARVSVRGAQSALPVAITQRGTPSRAVLIFIDSLSREVATDTARMPFLARLAREGASFDVEPCRDQLTYLCLRAALTGHDESSLLAISDNFRPEHEGPPENLLSALARSGQRVSVIGSNDFHPYRRALFSERSLAKTDESPARVGALLSASQADAARLVIVSLASGDMAAHAHGVNSAEYAEAFSRLDRVVETVAASLAPDEQLVVFGDHGHDALGRHLPGTWQKTWAAYRGPAFRAGAHHALSITDHRALLGVLLGLPSEATYRGPPLASIFDAHWSQRVFTSGLPKLSAPPLQTGQASPHQWLLAVAVAVFALAACGCALRGTPGRGSLAVAALLVALAAASGLGYDAIRRLVHDHGDSPERSLVLLVPLALGVFGASWLARARVFGLEAVRFLPRAAGAVLVVTWLIMLPTAYFYGARRAAILAALLALLALAIDCIRHRRARIEQLIGPWLALLFAAAALFSLYPVRQLGPETAQASTWALDARLYQHWAPFALVVAKAVLYALVVAPRSARRPLDSAGAAGLFTASLLIELAAARMPREAYAVLLAALALGVVFARRHAPSSLFAGALLLLDHLYGGNAKLIAPIETILAGVAAALFAGRRLLPAPHAKPWFTALTVSLAVYLMLWPSVGFHLAGIDFAFMFQWVPAAQYQQAWQLIALGVVLKLALPVALVVSVAREPLRQAEARAGVMLVLAAKTALLAVLIAFYAVDHGLGSQQATAMLAELALVMFVSGCALAALPSRKTQIEPALRRSACAEVGPRLGTSH